MTFWWHLTFPDENGIAQYGLCLIIIEAFTSYALDKSQTLEKCMSCRTNQNVRHCLKLWGREIRNKNTVQSHINRVTIQFISHLNHYFNFSASFLFFLLRVSSSSILDLSDLGYEIGFDITTVALWTQISWQTCTQLGWKCCKTSPLFVLLHTLREK